MDNIGAWLIIISYSSYGAIRLGLDIGDKLKAKIREGNE